MYKPGRHFLQIPGPTNVPDRVLRAIDSPTIDHRSAEFAELGKCCLEGVKDVFQSSRPVLIYPASGTGAWEAALVNTLSAGDRVLAFENGHFANLWTSVARNLGLSVDPIEGDWRHGVEAEAIGARLAKDPASTSSSAGVSAARRRQTWIACSVTRMTATQSTRSARAALRLSSVIA